MGKEEKRRFTHRVNYFSRKEQIERTINFFLFIKKSMITLKVTSGFALKGNINSPFYNNIESIVLICKKKNKLKHTDIVLLCIIDVVIYIK